MKKTAAKKIKLVGRQQEMLQIEACLLSNKNVLIEGPVGVGKTQLAIEVTERLGLPVYRVDGDSRFTEQKLTGWFDPPTVMKKGYSKDAFISGPLLQAMQKGGVLFINELNRLPEGVQNVLLPAIDERTVQVPKLGTITAHANFKVVATQNPKEFVATSHLSEAILDRFELLILDYPSFEEEVSIVEERIISKSPQAKKIIRFAVHVIRRTRQHPKVKRGASVRGAMSIADIALGYLQNGGAKIDLESAFLIGALMSLPTRIELHRISDSELSYQAEVEAFIRELVTEVLSGATPNEPEDEKKNTR